MAAEERLPGGLSDALRLLRARRAARPRGDAGPGRVLSGRGAHGIAALGLGTEVSKLTPEERLAVVTWVAEDLAGRRPLAITVFGATPAEQTAFVRAAAEHGADWVILQPPQTGERDHRGPAGRLLRRGGRRLAPAGRDPERAAVHRRRPDQRRARPAEPPTIPTSACSRPRARRSRPAALIELTAGRMAVFQGRGGMEFTDVMRAGCAGMIPSVESCRLQVRLFELMRSGRAEDEAAAERLYAELCAADHLPDAVGRRSSCATASGSRRAASGSPRSTTARPRRRRPIRPRLPLPPRGGAGSRRGPGLVAALGDRRDREDLDPPGRQRADLAHLAAEQRPRDRRRPGDLAGGRIGLVLADQLEGRPPCRRRARS